VIEEDFFKAARKLKEAKKLETKLDYAKIWFVVECILVLVYKNFMIIN